MKMFVDFFLMLYTSATLDVFLWDFAPGIPMIPSASLLIKRKMHSSLSLSLRCRFVVFLGYKGSEHLQSTLPIALFLFGLHGTSPIYHNLMIEKPFMSYANN